MYLEFEKNSDILIVKLTGELDHHNAEEMRAKIDDRIDKSNINKLILDFEKVNFMDSSGIGAVVGRYKKMKAKDGSISIVNISKNIKKVFELSGLFQIIKCYNDVSEALECMWWRVLVMYDNKVKIEFESKSQNEGFARVAIAAFASQLDPTIEELTDIKTAISEAVTNSIIHGYENMDNGIIQIEAEIEDRNIKVTVIDFGKGIFDISKAVEPLYTSRPDLERSGMGFTVMETFMDSMNVESEEGKGTKVVLIKKIGTVS